MRNLFQFVGWRHLRTKPVRTILTTLGVALGIALYVAIEIINRSTLSSFKESVEAVAGKASLTVSAGEAGFPEERLEVIKKVPGIRHAVPMIEARAYFAEDRQASETLMVLGVDLLQESAVRTYKTSDEQVIDDPLVFLNQPDSLIVTHAFAKAHALKIDSKISLATARGRQQFTVRGMLSPEGPAKAFGGSIAIMDIDGARVSFGKEGRTDRVDIVVREGEKIEEVAGRLRSGLGAGYKVERPESQSEGMERMVESFQVMLKFFSTLALLVGLFLVTNSVSIAVAERRREIGTLRALGATRWGILALFLSEAVMMGAIGALAGSLLGRGLAEALVKLVAASMSSQYLTRIEVARLEFGAGNVVQAVVIGALASLVAALWPALRATTIQPLEAMRNREVGEDAAKRGFFHYGPWLGAAALGWLALSYSAQWHLRHAWIETVNQIGAILGSALVGPALVAFLVRAFRPLVSLSGSTVSRLAQDNLLRNPRRTGSNVMSLMVGLVLVILIASVNSSFRVTIMTWFGRVLSADVMVSSQGRMISYQAQPLHEDFGKELARVPGVLPLRDTGSVFGTRFIHIDYQGKSLGLKSFDESPAEEGYGPFDMVSELGPASRRDLFHGTEKGVFVSSNFALHFGKKEGDTVELSTPSGAASFRVLGVVMDFASPVGVFYMDRKLYRELWRDPLVNAFGLRIAPGFDPRAVRLEIDRRFGESRNVTTLSNSELKAEMLRTVDMSFAYTRAIEWAALLVGLLGLLNTLLVSVMERTRELGMLRAVGMSRGQMSRMILQEALVQGGFGAIVAVVLGTGIAYMWITHSLAHMLGWIIEFHFPWLAVATTVLIGVAVALIAGIYPSRRAANIDIREALEYE